MTHMSYHSYTTYHVTEVCRLGHHVDRGRDLRHRRRDVHDLGTAVASVSAAFRFAALTSRARSFPLPAFVSPFSPARRFEDLVLRFEGRAD